MQIKVECFGVAYGVKVKNNKNADLAQKTEGRK